MIEKQIYKYEYNAENQLKAVKGIHSVSAIHGTIEPHSEF